MSIPIPIPIPPAPSLLTAAEQLRIQGVLYQIAAGTGNSTQPAPALLPSSPPNANAHSGVDPAS